MEARYETIAIYQLQITLVLSPSIKYIYTHFKDAARYKKCLFIMSPIATGLYYYVIVCFRMPESIIIFISPVHISTYLLCNTQLQDARVDCNIYYFRDYVSALMLVMAWCNTAYMVFLYLKHELFIL